MKLFLNNIVSLTKVCHTRKFGSKKDITKTPHTHDFFEFFLIDSGQINYLINGKSFPLSEGALSLVRPDDSHSYADIDYSECSMYNIAFDQKNVKELAFFLGDREFMKWLYSSKDPLFCQLSLAENKAFTQEIEELIQLKDFERQAYLLRKLLIKIIAFLQKTNVKVNAAVPIWLENFKRKLEDAKYFNPDFDIYKLANKSQPHLIRLFKKHYQTTPLQFHNACKLHHAMTLLTSTKQPIIEVCFQCGFQSVSYFNKLFKAQYNSTPSAFRKNHPLYEKIS